MSNTVRAGVIFGIAAVVAFIGGLFFPLPPLNYVLAFGSMIALGWGAGYTAAKTAPVGSERGVGRGATAGLIAGGVMLIASVIIFALLANLSPIREAISAAVQQQGVVDPNTGNPTSVDPTAATLSTGAGAGFCLGLINLLLLAAGGAVGGFLWRGVPSSGATTDDAATVRTYDRSEPR
jgi:hypothetical protein